MDTLENWENRETSYLLYLLYKVDAASIISCWQNFRKTSQQVTPTYEDGDETNPHYAYLEDICPYNSFQSS